MRASSFLPLLAVAALLGAGARRAAAQGGPSVAAVAPVVTHWSLHPAGKFRLELALPDRKMEADLTISDSSGTPTAIFWPVGDNDGHSLAVTVKDTALVLTAATPRGPFEMVLQRQGDQVSGHYAMGMQESGAVQGHVEDEAKKP